MNLQQITMIVNWIADGSLFLSSIVLFVASRKSIKAAQRWDTLSKESTQIVINNAQLSEIINQRMMEVASLYNCVQKERGEREEETHGL